MNARVTCNNGKCTIISPPENIMNYIKIQNLVNEKLIAFWNAAKNKYSISGYDNWKYCLPMDPSSVVVTYEGEKYLTITVHYFTALGDMRDGNMDISKDILILNSADLEEYLTIQSMKRLQNVIFEEKEKIREIIKNAENSKYFNKQLD